MKYFYYLFYPIIIIAAILYGIINYPPEFIPVNDETYQLTYVDDGVEKKIEARLGWKQDCYKLKDILILYPKEKELIYYNEEEKITWGIKPEYKAEMETKYEAVFNIPLWRYYYFLIVASGLVIIVAINYLLVEAFDDRKKWERTMEEDSFSAYKNYINDDELLKLYKSKAKSRITTKADEYKMFVRVMLSENKSSGKEFLLSAFDQIAKSGNLNIGFKISFGGTARNIEDVIKRYFEKIEETKARSDEELQKDGVTREEVLKAEKDFHEFLEENKNRIKNSKKISPFFKKKYNSIREKTIGMISQKVINAVLPDSVFLISEKKEEVRIEIKYNIYSDLSWFEYKGTKHSPKNTLYIPCMEIDWELDFYINDEKIDHLEITTVNNNTIKRTGEDYSDYVEAIMRSNFVNFGRKLFEYFGYSNSLSEEETSRMAATALKEKKEKMMSQIKAKIKDESVGAAEDEAKGFVEDFLAENDELLKAIQISSLIDMENQFTNILDNISGEDIADATAEVIESLFSE